MSSFYVAPTGSDIAVGSTQAPWLTLQHAANTVHPGDTVIVEPGTYLGFRLFTSGTISQPITFESATGSAGSVTIHAAPDPNSATPLRGILLAGSYVTVDGFWVENAPTDGILVAGQNDTIRNSVFYHNGWGITDPQSFGGEGILTGGQADGIQILDDQCYDNREHGIYIGAGADRSVIIGNTLYDNGNTASGRGSGLQINADGTFWPSVGAVVERNDVYDNVNNGFSFQGLQDSLIANNVIYGNHSATAVVLAKGSIDNSFVNNTVISPTNASAITRAVDIGSSGNYPPNTGNQFFNNILVAVGGIPLTFQNANPPAASDFNLLWAGLNRPIALNDTTLQRWSLAQWQRAGSDQHSLIGDPLFIAPSLGDFHLNTTSLAYDSGVALNAASQPSLSSMGQGYEMGAYGYETLLTSAPLNMDQAPYAKKRSIGVAENQTLTVSPQYGIVATSQSYTGRPLTAILVQGPAHGTLKLKSDGSFIYTPNLGFIGTVTFIYEVSDGLQLSNPATVTINVS
jgi:parallel beta-helix repeat protein